MINNRIFYLNKQNFTQSDWTDQTFELAENQVTLKVDRVALTSNNTTYAVLGEHMHYWDFFQSYAPDAASGVLPVWGFAEVVETNVSEIKPGDRYFGFWPFARYAVVTPEKITDSGFLDATPPKPNLALSYRTFLKLAPLSPQQESFNALFRPLGITAWLLANELTKKVLSDRIAKIILSSASSKTALATAAILRSKLEKAGLSAILSGLTSKSNEEFVTGTQFFNEVVLYDNISDVVTSPNSIYVDFSGNVNVRNQVHQQFQDNLVESINVGATDWLGVTKRQSQPLPGPTPYVFFAPTVYQDTARELGHKEVSSEIEKSMQLLAPLAQGMAIKEITSEQETGAVWQDLLAGKISANEAVILRL